VNDNESTLPPNTRHGLFDRHTVRLNGAMNCISPSTEL
jgi:hypothetical protein